MKKYTYRNSTDNVTEVVLSDIIPTECLNNTHTFDASSLTVSTEDFTKNDGTPVYQQVSLDSYKRLKLNEIDARTEELIGNGFEYPASSGQIFSFSENAQNNLLGAYSAKDLVGYPFDWNTKDDSVTIQLADAAEMTTFFMTALGTKKAHQDSGTALKTSVTNAVDRAGVDAVIDNR